MALILIMYLHSQSQLKGQRSSDGDLSLYTLVGATVDLKFQSAMKRDPRVSLYNSGQRHCQCSNEIGRQHAAGHIFGVTFEAVQWL